MTTKRFLIAWLGTTIVLFILNGIFHGVVAADFFDKNSEGLGAAAVKMADFNPAPVALLEVLLGFCLTWIISKTNTEKISLQDAVVIGGLFHLSTSASWNLANMATLVSWPVQLAAGDIAWHILMGIVGGWLIFKLGIRKA